MMMELGGIFIPTIPMFTFCEKNLAFSPLLVKIQQPFPNLLSLMIFIPSSVESTSIICKTGPKISVS